MARVKNLLVDGASYACQSLRIADKRCLGVLLVSALTRVIFDMEPRFPETLLDLASPWTQHLLPVPKQIEIPRRAVSDMDTLSR